MTTSQTLAARTALGAAAHAAAVLSAAAVVLAAVLTFSTPPAHRALDLGPTPAVGLLAAAVGALIVARRPRNVVAWMLIASGTTAAAYSLATAATALGLLADPQAPWLLWTAWVSSAGWVPGAMLGLVLMPQLFPYGVLLPGRFWLAWWWFSAGLAGAVFMVLAAAPASPLFPELANPWLAVDGDGAAGAAAVVRAAAVPLGLVLTILFVFLSVGSAVNLVLRFRRSDAAARRKTRLVLAAWLLLLTTGALAVPWLGVVAAAAYLGALLVSVARLRLYEIDQLVSRGAAGLLVLVVLGAAYALTASGVGALLGNAAGSWTAGFAATSVVVVLLDPVRRLSVHWINRLFARGRPGAEELTGAISTIAAQAATPRDALEDCTALLRSTLHMPELEIRTGEEGAATGAGSGADEFSSAAPRPLPLHWNGRKIGALAPAPRRGSARVQGADLRLLAALEPALALLLHDLQLTSELEASRGAVLGAREEERRRIRRDLHDGLGPLLAGTAMTLRAAAAGRSGGAAQALLAQSGADLEQAIADIRLLVDGLRPPILDDLGLVAAVEAVLPESALAVTVTAQGDCRNLPAAVEVAVLRIAAEALTNAARHAKAGSAHVELRRTRARLHLSVVDDGQWVPPSSVRPGVGMESMRQRAQELGGRATIAPNGTSGTRVRAWLPLPGRAGEVA